MSETALSVRDLSVSFGAGSHSVKVVDGISFEIQAGEIVGLVGESGCGKSITAAAVIGLLPSPAATMSAGHILLAGRDLTGLNDAGMRKLRGKELSMVFQEPLTALDPVFTVGAQLASVIRRHRSENRKKALAISIEILDLVGIADAPRIMNTYPHQLSGGMRQRVLTAMALACRPRVLIADEPTTSLDVTTQAQVLDQLTSLGRSFGTAILLITHDLGVVAQTCDRALVMRDGKILEQSAVVPLFAAPSHPYTASLLSAVPRLQSPIEHESHEEPGEQEKPLLSIRKLLVQHAGGGGGRQKLTAVKEVSFDIQKGTIFGLVGESGSGKTSLAQTVAQLIQPSGGQVLFHGKDLSTVKQNDRRTARKNIQIVFQDPLASLSPRRSILQSLLEPLIHFGIDDPSQNFTRVVAALEKVDLDQKVLARYPHELSGGQRQRVALARALVCEPELIIADEAVSSLDVSVQAKILRLILQLRDSTGVAFLFVSHDLAVVRQLADVVGVMYLGQLLEMAPASELFQHAAHPYTQSLINAVPAPDPQIARPIALKGEAPSPLTPPPGCVFHTRCLEVMEHCRRFEPLEKDIAEHRTGKKTHLVRCHLCNS